MEADDTTGCTYHPAKAKECLDGAWVCEGEGEFAYAVPPDACLEVYTDCPEPAGATEEEFAAYFSTEKICDLMLVCNPSFDCSIFDDMEPADTSDCTYDPVSALECMEGEWTCEGEGASAYAVGPIACGEAYDCPLD